MKAYCFKCKSNVDIKDSERVTFSNRRHATKGYCTNCDTKVFRIIS